MTNCSDAAQAVVISFVSMRLSQLTVPLSLTISALSQHYNHAFILANVSLSLEFFIQNHKF
jgi:hypothetical protein